MRKAYVELNFIGNEHELLSKYRKYTTDRTNNP